MSGLMFNPISGNGKRGREVAEFGGLLPEDDADQEVYDEFCEEEEEDDGEGPVESMLRHAAEIEAGLVPGWKLDRTHPGVLVWTTPSGRRYESTLDGSSYRPFPGG
jgi:hypothetical protein